MSRQISVKLLGLIEIYLHCIKKSVYFKEGDPESYVVILCEASCQINPLVKKLGFDFYLKDEKYLKTREDAILALKVIKSMVLLNL